MFHVPAGFHELNGEPVQEVRMAGSRGLSPEVLESRDDSVAEQFSPPAVDRHAGREGVVPVDQPLSQCEPIRRVGPIIRLAGKSENGGCPRPNPFSW